MAAASPAAQRTFYRALLQPSLQFYFAFLAAGYTLAALYGSFVPFRFVWPASTLAAVQDSLAAIQTRGAVSLFDGLANVALFTPLGFLWSAAALYSASQRQRLLRSLAIVVGAAALSAVIECVQLGLPDRTFSPLDVVAETIGATLGCAAWWIFGQRWTIWLSGWQAHDAQSRLWSWALQLYLAGVSVWWLMPLDLTCRPGELAAKVRERVVLKPFSELTFARGLDAAIALTLFVPVGTLLATAGRARSESSRSELESRWWIIALTATLAAGQFLVFSRTTDILQIAALGLGMAAGVRLSSLARAISTGSSYWHRPQWMPKQYTESSTSAFPVRRDAASLALHWVYPAAVLFALAALGWSFYRASPGELWFTGRAIPNWQPTWPYACYWFASIGTLYLAPRIPILGPLVFVLLAYGVFHRADLGAEYFRAIGGLEMVAVLGFAAVKIAASKQTHKMGNLAVLGWLVCGYALGAFASAGYLVLDGREWRAPVTVQCIRLFDCAILYWTAAQMVPTRPSMVWLAWVLTVGLFLPGILFPEQTYMNHVTASLVAIALPLTLYALVQSPSLPLQIALGLMLIKLVGILYAGQSRSALAGAAAALLTYGALSRYRWLWLGILVPTTLIVWQASNESFVAERFRALLQQQQGWDTGRLEIWQYAMSQFRASPWLGMGPGTGPEDLNDVHNSYLAVLSETGAVGLALYVLVWLATIVVLVWHIFTTTERWKSDAAKPLLAAIVAHLVIGVGYSLHALQLAFLLAGFGVALAVSSHWPYLAGSDSSGGSAEN